MTRIMLEAFESKSILYVYQNTRSKKNCPQNILNKKYFFLPKMPPPPHSVLSLYVVGLLVKMLKILVKT